MRHHHRIPVAIAVLAALMSDGLDQTTFAARGEASRSTVYGRSGMVCASQPLAAQAGIDILKAGGSAVDAAIAVNACLGLMEPTANGVGGDLFAIVWDPKSGRLHGLNACGRSPRELTADRIPREPDGTIPLYSPYAWSVPGCVDGWAELHARFGKLPLTRIAEKGRKGYYEGPVADAIVRYSRQQGGFFTLADLSQHRSEWVDPVSTSYRGYDVWELPPPGQGIAALQMLNMIETFDVKAMGRGSARFWHTMTEIKKLAFADRARHYADPEFVKVPVRELVSKEYARARLTTLDLTRVAQVDAPGDPVALSRPETTYLCAADADGMMVSLIQSNYTGFGSGYVIPELGFGLQNRGNLFDLTEGRPNSYAPGKRPFHTIIPAFVTQGGQPVMAFGLMGGDMQPQGHAQVIVNLVDFGMNLQEAGDAIRFHHTGSSEPTGTVMRDGGVLHIEDGLPAEVLAELRRLGHRIEPEPVGAYGGYQAIWRDPRSGVYSGATERRKDGCAIGY